MIKKEFDMPMVGNKKFPYTKEGKKEAKAYGAKKAMPVAIMVAVGRPKMVAKKMPKGKMK
jgi:hypothetical protein